ncbi:MAG: hypothetical protein ACO2OX_01450 [Candidatus Nanopusillus sp.]
MIEILVNNLLKSFQNKKYILLIFDRYELIRGLKQEDYKFYYYFDTEQDLHIYIIPIDHEYAIKWKIKNKKEITYIDYKTLKYVVLYDTQNDKLIYYFPIQEKDEVEIFVNYKDFVNQIKNKFKIYYSKFDKLLSEQ